MTYTEDEAKSKWCPQARTVETWPHGNTAPRNRVVECDDGAEPRLEGSLAGGMCIGSNCMMWRWAQKPNPDWRPDNGMMSTFGRDTRNDAPMYIADTTRGYCGLAGRP